VTVTERRGEPAGERALARAGRAVDGDDQPSHNSPSV
jgi:hypothetical protein